MSYENMSPADYAAVTRNNDSGMFGGENGAWWIIILLLFGWGGRGFGGGFGGAMYASFEIERAEGQELVDLAERMGYDLTPYIEEITSYF